jgi:hypothetical protein
VTRTVQIDAEIPTSREIVIRLPDDVPPGMAHIVLAVTSEESAPSPRRTLGDLLRSDLFGLWADREDITDSAEFARDLRTEAWQRH